MKREQGREPAIRVFIRYVFDFLFWLLTRAEFYGLENAPARGPFLVVTNHLSYVDPPLIFIALRRTDMVALAADIYKKNPLFRWIVETVGGVWVHREGGDRAALRAAIGVLKDGKILGMAPEGTRSKVTHALMRGKGGAAYIAGKTGVPILPVAVTGTETVLSEVKRLRRPRVTISMGPIFILPPLEGHEDKGQALDGYTHEIMCRIAALLPERYQGVYQGDPRIKVIQEMTGPGVQTRPDPSPAVS
jgi:1-acyl-sn-glycerol-3-phosphate acyltransferase